MINFFFIIFSFLLSLGEGIYLSFYLVLPFLIVYALVKREGTVFIFAFLSGLLLDLLSARPLGVTSLFFVSYLFMLYLYQKKYEITSLMFVFLASLVGCLLYGLLFPVPNLTQRVILGSISALVLYIISKYFFSPPVSKYTDLK